MWSPSQQLLQVPFLPVWVSFLFIKFSRRTPLAKGAVWRVPLSRFGEPDLFAPVGGPSCPILVLTIHLVRVAGFLSI